MAKVTKDTMIGELLQIDADIAPMLLNIGMHGLGCPSSQMETIAAASGVPTCCDCATSSGVGAASGGITSTSSSFTG